jgi:hypothetical protein
MRDTRVPNDRVGRGPEYRPATLQAECLLNGCTSEAFLFI